MRPVWSIIPFPVWHSPSQPGIFQSNFKYKFGLGTLGGPDFYLGGKDSCSVISLISYKRCYKSNPTVSKLRVTVEGLSIVGLAIQGPANDVPMPLALYRGVLAVQERMILEYTLGNLSRGTCPTGWGCRMSQRIWKKWAEQAVFASAACYSISSMTLCIPTWYV